MVIKYLKISHEQDTNIGNGNMNLACQLNYVLMYYLGLNFTELSLEVGD